MAIELWVVQFWSEIIIVISNGTRAVRSFDFEITRMISDQIALHSSSITLFIHGGMKPRSGIITVVTTFFLLLNTVMCAALWCIRYIIPHLYFLVQEPLGECVYQENTSDKWDIPCYTTRERYITILFHAIKRSGQHPQCDIRVTHDGKVGCSTVEYTSFLISCILIGCIFYGMV